MRELQWHEQVALSPLASGSDPAPRAGSEHAVQFYQDDGALCESVASFLAAGLEAGESLLVIATEAHRQALCRSLNEKGLELQCALLEGRATLLDARETLSRIMVGALPDWERFRTVVDSVVAPRNGPGGKPVRVRAYGEMVHLLWRDGNPRAAHLLEEFWNELGRQHAFSLLCAYRMDDFERDSDRASFLAVCRAHSQVMPVETWSDSDDPGTRRRKVSLLQQRARALETELTHRRKLEEELRSARKVAEAASLAKDEFLAMLGHELRNPLSPILTALELMKLRNGGRVTREQEVIDRQTRHLIRLVDDLLDVSRVTRGKVELRRQPIDLRDVLAKASEIASPLLEERRHRFQVSAVPGRLTLLADETRLTQVLANLLTNAAKYTEPGGHIAVTARREGAELVIEVRDDGVGIAPELLPRVFEPFVQGSQSNERANGGLGIGLALVRNLVTLHGGAVEARSPGLGKGSTFIVRLPALEAGGEAQDGVEAEGALPFEPATRRRRRILVVDDNEDALELIGELLRSVGHEVRTATSGPSALHLIGGFKPEVAILDLGLPAMDGYELAARLRAALGPASPRLMALSGYGQESDRVRSRAAGFCLHLVKPLEAAELVATIERELESGPPNAA